MAFKLLRDILTRSVFEQLVEQELTPRSDIETPQSYSDILKLKPRGLVTLNLDKFLGQALAKVSGTNINLPVFGKELAQKWNSLHTPQTYLVYLHGGIHDPSTWVMTQDDLSEIMASDGHGHFLRTLFTENLVLFVGVSADDIALSGRLLELTTAGFRPKNLYWLTSRVDDEAETWANAAYVSLIRYEAKTNDAHITAIRDFVQSCETFVSKDVPQPPLMGSSDLISMSEEQLTTDPEELAQRGPEEIRQCVAVLLDRELSKSTISDSVFTLYREFCETYNYAVHRAFYRGKAEKYRDWFGYKLDVPCLGKGNFGEVYSAQDTTGNLVAVKIMHESIFGNDEMLGGFRRGVRSMEIVTKNSIPGMMPILRSYELPPTIVMPYIQGENLEESLRRRPNLSWIIKLEIARKIGKIVAAGHALPETILHRDLKPSNIMITNFEDHGQFDPEIIVLDFDMSWHKGSKERDITFESRDDFGYLAPEQTDAGNKFAARSTRVDAYGFGMTLFYMFGLEAPRPNEALSDYWPTRAAKAATRDYDCDWVSAPMRLGNLISRATRMDQNLRVDFATMVYELDFLYQAVTEPKELNNPELWAEEILSSIANGLPYEWINTEAFGTYRNPNGINIECRSNFRDACVILNINYADRGVTERTSLNKYLGPAISESEKILRSGGWTIVDRRIGGREIALSAKISLNTLKIGSNPISAVIDTMKEFRFL